MALFFHCIFPGEKSDCINVLLLYFLLSGILKTNNQKFKSKRKSLKLYYKKIQNRVIKA